LIRYNGSLPERDNVPIDAGDQTQQQHTKVQMQQKSTKSSQNSYKHSYTVISQHLFTSPDEMK